MGIIDFFSLSGLLLILITVPSAPFAAYHCPAAALTVVFWLMKKSTTTVPLAVITLEITTTRVLGEALKAGGGDGCDGGEAESWWQRRDERHISLTHTHFAAAGQHLQQGVLSPCQILALSALKKTGKKSFCSRKVQFYVFACEWVLLNVCAAVLC